MTGLTYKEGADGLMYPDVTRNPDNYPLGKYGRMRKRYLRENLPAAYSHMTGLGILNRHCSEVEAQATERKDEIVSQLQKQNPPPQSNDFMERVRYNTGIDHQAETLVLEELIYSPTT